MCKTVNTSVLINIFWTTVITKVKKSAGHAEQITDLYSEKYLYFYPTGSGKSEAFLTPLYNTEM